MLIRPLTQSDSSAVRRLDSEILGEDRSQTWDSYIDRFLAVAELDSLPFPPWGCFVAESDRKIVGFLFAEKQSTGYGLPPGARIVAIAVHPEHRRSGVAAGLVNSLLALCENEGIGQVFSAILAADRRDIRFLRAMGFDDAQVKVLTRSIDTSSEDGQASEGEIRAYDALVAKASEYLQQTRDRGGDVLTTALSQAQEFTGAAGGFTAEQIDRASNYVRRDLTSLFENRDRGREFVRDRLRFSRVKGGFLSLASDVLDRAGSGLSRLGERVEPDERFNTGEVTGPGTLTCDSCGSQMRFQDSGRIPPCPKCHTTHFKKSY